jgi:type VI secretion system protein ImpF
MPRNDAASGLTESLLDRLIDTEPTNTHEAGSARAVSMRHIKASLRRDLEWLLNTRQMIVPPPDYARELPYSLFTWGLPDFTTFSRHSDNDQQAMLRIMETAISTFEPRLQNVIITMQAPGEAARLLHFQIEGMLRTDPAPERIVFDTVLELSSGEYQVGRDNSAR